MRTAYRVQAGMWLLVASSVWLIVGGGAGCATVQRAREVQRSDRVSVGERTLTAVEVGLNSNSVLTLDEAVRIAVAYQPAMVQASQNVVAAEAQVRQARAGYGPTVNANASYSRASSNTKEAPGGGESSDSYRAGLELDLLVYDFGRTPAVVRQAVERWVSAESGFRAARSDVVYGVRTAFLDLGKAQELLQVADEAVRQYQAHLEQVRAFAEAGRRTRYDVTKGELDLGNAKLSWVVARADLASARAALNSAIGLAEEPGYRIGAAPTDESGGDTDEGLAAALGRHPDLQSLRAEERVASAAIDAAVAELYPSLSVGAGYSAAGAAFPLVLNWSAALRSALRVFDRSARTAKIDEAVTRFRAARARVAAREQALRRELATALARRDSARERVSLSGLTLRHAEEALAQIDERYRQGKASAVEVTDAQVALTGAKAEGVKARFEYQAAVAQIKHAIGEE